MDFRVEVTDRAKADIAAIYAWLVGQEGGEASVRWFGSRCGDLSSRGFFKLAI